MASNTKKHKARRQRKLKKLQGKKSDVVTLASRRRKANQAPLISQGGGSD